MSAIGPDGIFAVNITNKHLDLRPVLFRLAEHFGLRVALVKNDRYEDASLPSLWAIATRNADFFRHPLVTPRIAPEERLKRISLWTDDYSNLFQILK